MKKNLFSASGLTLLIIFIACLVNLAVMPLVVNIVDLFIVVDYFKSVVIKLVVSAIVVPGILGAVRYLLSYRTAEFDLGFSSGAFFIGSAMQLLICILFKFYPFIGGGVFYLAGIFENGSGFTDAEHIEYIGIIDYLLAFAVFLVLNYAVFTLCGISGKKKRLRDRAELTKSENN